MNEQLIEDFTTDSAVLKVEKLPMIDDKIAFTSDSSTEAFAELLYKALKTYKRLFLLVDVDGILEGRAMQRAARENMNRLYGDKVKAAVLKSGGIDYTLFSV